MEEKKDRIDRQTDGRMEEKKDRIDRQTDRRMEEKKDRIDRQTDRQSYKKYINKRNKIKRRKTFLIVTSCQPHRVSSR